MVQLRHYNQYKQLCMQDDREPRTYAYITVRAAQRYSIELLPRIEFTRLRITQVLTRLLQLHVRSPTSTVQMSLKAVLSPEYVRVRD